MGSVRPRVWWVVLLSSVTDATEAQPLVRCVLFGSLIFPSCRQRFGAYGDRRPGSFLATPLIIARFGIKLLYSRMILVRLPLGRIVRYEIAEASGSAPGQDCSNTLEKVPSYGRSSCPSAWRSCPTTGRSGGGASRILGSESVGWNKRRCGRGWSPQERRSGPLG